MNGWTPLQMRAAVVLEGSSHAAGAWIPKDFAEIIIRSYADEFAKIRTEALAEGITIGEFAARDGGK